MRHLLELIRPGAQARDLVDETVERAGDRVGDVAAHGIGLEGRPRLGGGVAPGDLAGRVADHRGAVGDLAQHHRGGADACPVADPERPQHLRAGTDDDTVAQARMALLPAGERGAAQGHALVKRAIVADFGGLADHHAHAVVDKQPPADFGTGVDFDPGQEPPEMRYEPSGEQPPSVRHSQCATR